MQSFRHLEPPLRLHSGPKCLDQLSVELDRLGCRRAVVLCGETLAREGTCVALVQAALGGRFAGVVAGARAHSPIPAVRTAADDLRRLRADAVVALGGGSAIVTARAASILLAEGGDIHRLATTRGPDGRLHSPRLGALKLPQFVLPTTPTTAAVKAGSAVYDLKSRRRLALYDPATRARAVFLHPDLLDTAPQTVCVSASLNTLAMALEGLTSTAGDPLADAQLIHAVRLVMANIYDPKQKVGAGARSNLMWAALLCGRGTDHTSGGVLSALSHAIGARHEVENGVINAILLPVTLQFNRDAAAGLHKVATAFGLDHGDQELLPPLLQALDDLFAQLPIPRRLRETPTPHADLQEIALLAMEDWFLHSNWRKVENPSDLQAILQAAW